VHYKAEARVRCVVEKTWAGSAHPLVEVNVSFKFEENPSIRKGVIEQTRHNV